MNDHAYSDHIFRLYDQQMRAGAGWYLRTPYGRPRSASDLNEVFHQLVLCARPSLFVEAGAHEATASLRAKRELPDCRVVAFEADPYNYARYAEATDFSRLEIEYLNLAVSDVPGPVQFNVTGGVCGESSLLQLSPDFKTDLVYETVTVPGTTLDSQFNADDLESAALWIDVEGATDKVLKGAEQFIRHCKIVKVEVEENPKWAGQWLSTDVAAYFLQRGFVPLARDFEYIGQHNILFASGEFSQRDDVWQVVGAYYDDLLAPNNRFPNRRHPIRSNKRLRRLAVRFGLRPEEWA